MRIFRLVAMLGIGAAGVGSAQRPSTQPQPEKLLMLPFPVTGGADSATSIHTMDVARDKLASMARYKVAVIPKAKICEALTASGFPCDGLMDEQQVRQLARFLQVDAFIVGVLTKSGSNLTARVRVIDVGGSGFAYSFSVDIGNPGTAQALGEAMAQRLNTIIRAAEHARECNAQRARAAFPRALEAARRAQQIDRDLPAAHMCIVLVYEAQRMPPDSLIAAASRALKGDSLNATAWVTIGRQYQVKGDTLRALDAFVHQLAGEPGNDPLRLGVAQQLAQHHQYQKAVDLLNEGLRLNPTNQAMIDRRTQICIEGELWRCALDGLTITVEKDTALLADTAFLKTAIGAAQQLSDTQALLRYSRAAARHHPRSASFWKALGAAYELAAQPDSAVWAYRHSLEIDPSDLASALLVAQTIIEGTTYDTLKAKEVAKDTARLNTLRSAFANRLDTARVYLERALASPDTVTRLNAAAIMRTSGEKLARAGAYDRAVAWLDRTLQIVEPRNAADTVGLRQAIRVNASFWYGLSSVPGLPLAYQAVTKTKSCADAKAFNDRLTRTRGALLLGRSVHAPTVDTYLRNVGRFEEVMPKVKQAFKCRNF